MSNIPIVYSLRLERLQNFVNVYTEYNKRNATVDRLNIFGHIEHVLKRKKNWL